MIDDPAKDLYLVDNIPLLASKELVKSILGDPESIELSPQIAAIYGCHKEAAECYLYRDDSLVVFYPPSSVTQGVCELEGGCLKLGKKNTLVTGDPISKIIELLGPPTERFEFDGELTLIYNRLEIRITLEFRDDLLVSTGLAMARPT